MRVALRATDSPPPNNKGSGGGSLAAVLGGGLVIAVLAAGAFVVIKGKRQKVGASGSGALGGGSRELLSVSLLLDGAQHIGGSE